MGRAKGSLVVVVQAGGALARLGHFPVPAPRGGARGGGGRGRGLEGGIEGKERGGVPEFRLRPSCGTRSAARVGAIAIQRVVHRKASAPPACAQSRASAGGAAFWHSGCKSGRFGAKPRCWRSEQARERASCGTRSAAREQFRSAVIIRTPLALRSIWNPVFESNCESRLASL